MSVSLRGPRPAPDPEPEMREAVHHVVDAGRSMLQSGIELAKLELRTTVPRVGLAAGFLAVALRLSIGAWFLLMGALFFWLRTMLSDAASLAVAGGVTLLTAGALVLLARREASAVQRERG